MAVLASPALVQEDGNSPLVIASREGNLEAVSALLSGREFDGTVLKGVVRLTPLVRSTVWTW